MRVLPGGATSVNVPIAHGSDTLPCQATVSVSTTSFNIDSAIVRFVPGEPSYPAITSLSYYNPAPVPSATGMVSASIAALSYYNPASVPSATGQVVTGVAALSYYNPASVPTQNGVVSTGVAGLSYYNPASVPAQNGAVSTGVAALSYYNPASVPSQSGEVQAGVTSLSYQNGSDSPQSLQGLGKESFATTSAGSAAPDEPAAVVSSLSVANGPTAFGVAPVKLTRGQQSHADNQRRQPGGRHRCGVPWRRHRPGDSRRAGRQRRRSQRGRRRARRRVGQGRNRARRCQRCWVESSGSPERDSGDRSMTFNTNAGMALLETIRRIRGAHSARPGSHCMERTGMDRQHRTPLTRSRRGMRSALIMAALAATLVAGGVAPAEAQFNSGSDGSHGPFPPVPSGGIPADGTDPIWNVLNGTVRYCSSYTLGSGVDGCNNGPGVVAQIPDPLGHGFGPGIYHFTDFNVPVVVGSGRYIVPVNYSPNVPVTVLSQNDIIFAGGPWSTVFYVRGQDGGNPSGSTAPFAVAGGKGGPGAFDGGASGNGGNAATNGNTGFGPTGGVGGIAGTVTGTD